MGSGSVALPIENKVRELDGKLWLGLNLVDRGYDVTIGPSWEIKYALDKIDPDIYFTKDPGDGNTAFFERLRSAGIGVCGLAPEVGVNSSVDTFMKNRQRSLNNMDVYFAWGDVTANTLGSYYEGSVCKDKIITTGNPRFDLVTNDMRSVYKNKSDDILDKYGEYILINTNFTLSNPITRKETYSKIQDVHPDRNLHQESIKESQVFYSFLELIFYILSSNIEKSLIIRPHPGEDHSTYQSIFEPYDGVYVEHYGDVRSWIAGANAVIHYDCTTGIEAALMETPVLSYQAAKQELSLQPLSQIVSQEVTSKYEVLSWLNEYNSPYKKYDINYEQKEQVRGYFPNIDELAAPKICDVIDDMAFGSVESNGYEHGIIDSIKFSIKGSRFGPTIVRLYDFIRDQLVEGDYQQARARQRQKFSGLTEEELIEKIELFFDFISTENVIIESVPKTRHTYTIRRA